MDFRDTPEEAAFRKEVRDWLAARYGEVKHPEVKPAEKAPEKSAAKPEEKPQVSR